MPFIIHDNAPPIGLATLPNDTRDVFERITKMLKEQRDAEEKERLMIGLAGVQDKDILHRFVSEDDSFVN